MKELIYTSARTGLRPGTSGFCTVAMSDGMPTAVVEFLERFSNVYRPIYKPFDPRASDNPVAISLIQVRIAGRVVTVLSRNAAAGTEHTGRTNNLAHHLVFDGIGLSTPSNPASLADSAGTFMTRWDEHPRILAPRELGEVAGPKGVCRTWEKATGDAGWAATVAACWRGREDQPLYLIYPAGTDILSLVAESIALLSPDRWGQATFSTYHTGTQPEATCIVRCVLAGSAQETEARRSDHIDLMNLAGPAPDGSLADRARGQVTADETQHGEVRIMDKRRTAPAAFIPAATNSTFEQTNQSKVHGANIGTQRTVAFGGGASRLWLLAFVLLFGVFTMINTGMAIFIATQLDNQKKLKDDVDKQSTAQNSELQAIVIEQKDEIGKLRVMTDKFEEHLVGRFKTEVAALISEQKKELAPITKAAPKILESVDSLKKTEETLRAQEKSKDDKIKNLENQLISEKSMNASLTESEADNLLQNAERRYLQQGDKAKEEGLQKLQHVIDKYSNTKAASFAKRLKKIIEIDSPQKSTEPQKK